MVLTILAIAPGWWLTACAQVQIPLRYPWAATANPAGLAMDSLPDTGQALIGYGLTSGGLRRPQQEASGRQLSLSTENYQHLNKATLYGSFSYTQSREKEVRMNDMLDVYKGTPYILADSVGGDWKKQFYHLQARAASGALVNGRLHAGLGIDYRLGTGARQNDPRPLDNNSSLSVLPGLTWSFRNGGFGLNGLYGTYKESIDILIKNANVPQRIYQLTGLGQYNIPMSITSGVSRYYNGKRYGGQSQLAFSLHRWIGLSTAGFRFYRENVTEGTSSTPRIVASLGEKEYTFGSSLHKKTGNRLQMLSLDLQRCDGTGTEHSWTSSQGVWQEVLVGDFYSSRKDNARITYRLLKEDPSGSPAWMLESSLAYNNLVNEYLYPYSIQSVKSLQPALRLQRTLPLAKGGLTAEARLSYYVRLQQQLYYQPMTTTSNLVSRLVLYPDQAYLAADKWNGGATLLYSQPGWEDKHTRWFIRTAADVYGAHSDKIKGQRLFLSFGIGVFY